MKTMKKTSMDAYCAIQSLFVPASLRQSVPLSAPVRHDPPPLFVSLQTEEKGAGVSVAQSTAQHSTAQHSTAQHSTAQLRLTALFSRTQKPQISFGMDNRRIGRGRYTLSDPAVFAARKGQRDGHGFPSPAESISAIISAGVTMKLLGGKCRRLPVTR